MTSQQQPTFAARLRFLLDGAALENSVSDNPSSPNLNFILPYLRLSLSSTRSSVPELSHLPTLAPLNNSAPVSGDNRVSFPRMRGSASSAFCPQRRKGNWCSWQVAGRAVAVQGSSVPLESRNVILKLEETWQVIGSKLLIFRLRLKAW